MRVDEDSFSCGSFDLFSGLFAILFDAEAAA
jgi:hypothetical protein